MANPYRIGVLGLSHDHVWNNLKELKESGLGVLVAAVAGHPPLLQRVRELYGCHTYTAREEMLAKEQLDAVYVYTDNRSGALVAAAAARKGLHVLIEKPMAADLKGADQLLAAGHQGGARVMVNWPFAWWPQLRKAIQMALAGDIGEVWQVKYRAAHAGPKEMGCSPYFCDWLYDAKSNGAGALMDYCCYGAVLARTLLGMPARVVGVAGRLCKEDIPVEDNAILVMSYPHGMAVAEGSWSQVGHLTGYLTAIYGTEATLLVEPRQGGRLFLANRDRPNGVELPVPLATDEMENASKHFLYALETGAPFTRLCQDGVGRDAQEILEAGLISVATGSEVSLPLKSFLDHEARP
jgi:predicted dehydrogenase